MTLARSVSMLVVTSLAALALLASAPACSGKTIGDDLTTKPEPTDPTNPTDPRQCTAIAVACDAGDVSLGSEKSCNASGADYCYSRTEPCSKSVLWCGHFTAHCKSVPFCDPGDTQVSGCPGADPGPGSSCYPRTACGNTILCFHSGCTPPKCDPGDAQVGDPSQCFQNPPLSCYSRASCNISITCARPTKPKP